VERAGNDADAFFNYRPEADLAGAKHEFCRVAVKSEVAESDDCCAACTGEKLASLYTEVWRQIKVGQFVGGLGRKWEEFENIQSTHPKNYSHRKLDPTLHLNFP
jgi:hypothetical protein